MPNRVVEFLASWSRQFGSHCNLEAWKKAHLLGLYLNDIAKKSENKHCDIIVKD